ncbi:MAG: uroporphyrinogen-III synthase [Vicinamibacterales bacterium]
MPEGISFKGLRVLSLESRRATEMASLITTYGGVPVVAPAMREIPLSENPAALAFADALVRGDYALVVLLTGVGTRVLLDVIASDRPIAPVKEALGRTRIAVRGPKPAGVLRELGLTPWVAAAEPNTWRELLAAIDAKASEVPLRGTHVAVQEYGVSNPELVEGLRTRGAMVTSVPVYRWALPEDVAPLEHAVEELSAGRIDVTLVTTATQVVHLLQIAARVGHEAAALAGLKRSVIASIGPTTSEELRRHGLERDMEPSHPKIGYLVREAAERALALLVSKG